VKTGKKFGQHWESLDVVARNQFMRSAGIRADASRESLPELDFESRPVGQRTMTVIDEDDLHVVIHFGNLGELLARASAA
jgi:uncharacterized protein (DUF169 family)